MGGGSFGGSFALATCKGASGASEKVWPRHIRVFRIYILGHQEPVPLYVLSGLVLRSFHFLSFTDCDTK